MQLISQIERVFDAKLQPVTSALEKFETVMMAVCNNIQSIIGEVKQQVDMTSSGIANVAESVQLGTEIYEARLKALEEKLSERDATMVSQSPCLVNHVDQIEKQIEMLTLKCTDQCSESVVLMTRVDELEED